MFSTATVNYHVKSPYSQAFYFDTNGDVGKPVSPELLSTQIQVQDIRRGDLTVNFEHNGITFESHTSQIVSFSKTTGWQETYNNELTALLSEKIGATEVIIFDHTVRRDSKNAIRRPARNVHNDYSPEGAKQRLVDLVGTKRAVEISKGHYAFVNLWRPIEGPIKTAPLGFIHPDSVSPDDWLEIALVYPDRQGHILGVTANHQHHWFYMSLMTPQDIVIFNVYDNQGKPYLAHGAMDLGNETGTTQPRISLETRTLILF
jgi:hypothetical protein